MHRLFVYGTLMSGQPNHRLMTTARFVRVAWTAPEYTLVSLGAFPGLIEGGTTAVRGEIYEADDVSLAELDRFEGVPDLYARRPVRMRVGPGVDAYVLPPGPASGWPVIASGDWTRDRH